MGLKLEESAAGTIRIDSYALERLRLKDSRLPKDIETFNAKIESIHFGFILHANLEKLTIDTNCRFQSEEEFVESIL